MVVTLSIQMNEWMDGWTARNHNAFTDAVGRQMHKSLCQLALKVKRKESNGNWQ